MKMLFKTINKNYIQCTACAHYCKITKNHFGICATRKNIDGKLFSCVYGKVSSINIDPIEKKPLYHFLPKTKVLSFGTFGCNFHCPWCQNFNISQINKQNKQIDYWGENIAPNEIVNLAILNNCPSIAYTYNEPAIFIEFARDTAKIARKKGIKNIFVTNGYLSSESFVEIKPYLDAANVDLKSFREKDYQHYCGAKLAPVLETIKKIYHHGIHLEITTLLIPGINDDEANIKKISQFIAKINPDIPWHISRFFPMYKMTDGQVTPIYNLKKAEEIGRENGLKNIYIGNI